MLNKTLHLTVAILLILSLSLYAQPRDGAGRGPDLEKRLADLKEKLALTDQQAENVKTIFEEMKTEMKTMFENGRPDRDKMRELKTKTDDKIIEILTEEQQIKYKEYLRDRDNRMRVGKGGDRPRRPGN